LVDAARNEGEAALNITADNAATAGTALAAAATAFPNLNVIRLR
jgi:hypothetical protein